MNITYSKSGNILLPNLKVPESSKEPLGIYGRMRRDYLKKNRHSIYSAMMLKGTLLSHLAEVDKTCREEAKLRIRAEAEKQGITEELKAQDMLKWTGLMNNIKNSVSEQIMHEFVYAEEGLQ